MMRYWIELCCVTICAATLMLFYSCANPDHQEREVIYGVKIYDISKDVDSLISEWNELGINTAFVSDRIARDNYFMQKAKTYGIQVFIIEPVFYTPEALSKDSSLYAITNKGRIARSEWLEMACPSNSKHVEQIKEKLAKNVIDCNPDGISLDFIRNFVYWEKVTPNQDPADIEHGCYCNNCLHDFFSSSGISLPANLSGLNDTANYIIHNYKDEWASWKTSLINSIVSEITDEIRNIKPEIRFNLHALPWRIGDYNGGILNMGGQDFSVLSKKVDFISPMCYAFMLDRDGEWIASVINDIDEQAKGKVLPSIQVKEAYKNEKLDDDTFKAYLEKALKTPSHGVVFWSWEQLEKDPSKKMIIKSVLND